MLFPPLYIVAYFFFSLAVALPISLVLGGYLFWRARNERQSYHSLLDDGHLEVKPVPKRSTPVLALISFAKAYGISVLTVFGGIILLLFVGVLVNTLSF